MCDENVIYNYYCTRSLYIFGVNLLCIKSWMDTSISLTYHLFSWQLSHVLQALEFTHLSEYHSAMLCTNFAAQLESMGLWQWAVFILMHIINHKE